MLLAGGYELSPKPSRCPETNVSQLEHQKAHLTKETGMAGNRLCIGMVSAQWWIVTENSGHSQFKENIGFCVGSYNSMTSGSVQFLEFSAQFDHLFGGDIQRRDLVRLPTVPNSENESGSMV